MLTADIKNRLLQILDSILQLHNESLLKSNATMSLSILQDCQNAAVHIGETLEHDMDHTEPIIHLLEDYCEELYIIAQTMSVTDTKVSQLNELIMQVIDFISKQKCKYKIVFFPYKASMWDSLESIWKACKKDERCECTVVPVPYYKLDAQQGTAQFCYEISDFPDDVPVKNYLDYNVKKEKPDIAYIHNPYDDCNYVTSVHPDYYSKNLKRFVKKLVYVPYYVTSGPVSEHHKYLSVYMHMDYMIAQSETFKNGFLGLPYYHKILPLGSPKFDRVIQKNSEENSNPHMWENLLSGKKSIMLNTSINCFLENGSLMLQKLKKVFDVFENYENIVLIWRPHPLIEATITSMRPELKAPYEQLVAYFCQKQIGILDRTPDITNTIKVADAYIGESSSSIVSLFEIAGKPVFILNNYITADFSDKEKRTILLADMIPTKQGGWILPLQYNGLFKLTDHMWDCIHFITRFPKQTKWTLTHIMALEKEKNLYLSPYDSTDFISINTEDGHTEKLAQKQDTNISSYAIVEYKDCLFYILNYQDAILQYNRKTKEWVKYEGIFKNLTEIPNVQKLSNIWSYASWKDLLWITAIHSNKILLFHLNSGTYSVLRIGEDTETYSAITCDATFTYIAESRTGNILYINRINQEKGVYKMPEGFFVQERTGSVPVAHLKLINAGKYIFTVPYNGNCMVKINKQTGKSSLFIKNFWDPGTEIHNDYSPHIHGKSFFAKQTDPDSLLVQRLFDGALAKANIETEEYTIQYPFMSKDSYQKFIAHQDGFEKPGEGNSFACRESRFFSLDTFLHQLLTPEQNDIRERQMESLSSMAANLDGTCGEKVHNYMMHILEQEMS